MTREFHCNYCQAKYRIEGTGQPVEVVYEPHESLVSCVMSLQSRLWDLEERDRVARGKRPRR